LRIGRKPGHERSFRHAGSHADAIGLVLSGALLPGAPSAIDASSLLNL
jgi:hypothetical protein